ncbi:hypothetical protein NMY22_g17581 [Coprinellus aureogranulatus]|nr:hypothetical protein NMY22_g17581 [Coprinellus aureogranulatus]
MTYCDSTRARPFLIPPMDKPCDVCSSKSSTAKAILLRCASCHKGYHHSQSPQLSSIFLSSIDSGCHNPPVTDQELVARIAANKKGDPKNGLGAWRCIFCLTPESNPELKTNTSNDAILTRNERAIKISDSEASHPAQPRPQVVLVSSDDEDTQRHLPREPAERKESTWDTIQANLARFKNRVQTTVAVFDRHLAPRTYEPPPWFDGSSSSSDVSSKHRRSNVDAATSLIPHRSRKPKEPSRANSDIFVFSYASWMDIKKKDDVSRIV